MAMTSSADCRLDPTCKVGFSATAFRGSLKQVQRKSLARSQHGAKHEKVATIEQ